MPATHVAIHPMTWEIMIGSYGYYELNDNSTAGREGLFFSPMKLSLRWTNSFFAGKKFSLGKQWWWYVVLISFAMCLPHPHQLLFRENLNVRWSNHRLPVSLLALIWSWELCIRTFLSPDLPHSVVGIYISKTNCIRFGSILYFKRFIHFLLYSYCTFSGFLKTLF